MFMNTISHGGGLGREAMEIGLQHTCNEIYNPADKIPVSIVFVIGDIEANTKLDILKGRFGCPNDVNQFISDQEAIDKYGFRNGWNAESQNKWG